MTAFSANLGFLWTDRPLADAIHAAGAAGFDAVECHWPYAEDASAVKAALDATGLMMLGLNTARGDVAAGENGLAALAGRTDDARAAIDAALAYAALINCPKIHVMAGCAEGDAAERCFIDNLRYATASDSDVTFLIEPLNHHDAPGYFLNHTDQARRIIDAVGAPNLKLMFDCYHIQILEGDLIRRLSANLDIIGHISLPAFRDADAPTRAMSIINISLRILQIWDMPLLSGLNTGRKKVIRMPVSAG